MMLGQSCVLEERYHINKDMSGIYEVSFSIKSDGEEEDKIDVDDGKVQDFEKMVLKINDVDGVEVVRSNFDDKGFDLSVNFDDIKSINALNDTVSEDKTPGAFSYEDNRLFFSMNLGEEGQGDMENSDKWLTHRVIITFEDKMRRVRSDGFKKIDKRTLVYDSSKSPKQDNISFSVKIKK